MAGIYTVHLEGLLKELCNVSPVSVVIGEYHQSTVRKWLIWNSALSTTLVFYFYAEIHQTKEDPSPPNTTDLVFK